MNVHTPTANAVVARVRRNGFQKAEAIPAIASEGYRAADLRSPEERRTY